MDSSENINIPADMGKIKLFGNPSLLKFKQNYHKTIPTRMLRTITGAYLKT